MAILIMTHNNVEQLRKEILSDLFLGDAVKFILSKLGKVNNKVILDSGCGSGEMSLFFALNGARVIGIDKENR